MNFSQLHERLRLELLRRIERNVLTAAWLAQKTGLRQPHISNFLRRKRRLSLSALDAVLAALSLSARDLDLPVGPVAASVPAFIPLTTSDAALLHPQIPPTLVTEHIQLPLSIQRAILSVRVTRRPGWERFVAITLSAEQAQPMEPRLHSGMVIVLDRHDRRVPSTSTEGSPPIFAMHFKGSLILRYVYLHGASFLLRPHSLDHPVQPLPIDPTLSAVDLVVGRLCATITAYLPRIT